MVRELRLNEADGDLRTPSRVNLAQIAIAWLGGGLVTAAAGVLGAILALIFAATLAVVLVLAGAILALAALVWRFGGRTTPKDSASNAPVIEARKVGHSWVAYGWEQQP